MRVTGYSERGAVNALLYEIACSNNALPLLERFLRLGHFPEAKQIGTGLTDAHVLVEQSLSDFGDADAVLLLDAGGAKTAVFLEAKIKPAQTKSWTLERQFEDFSQGCLTVCGLNSSNVFTQIYHKARLMDGLRSGGIPRLQEGLKFPDPSRKAVRRIGSNPIVLRAIEEIYPYRNDVWFLSLVPDKPPAVHLFFDQFKNIAWPPPFADTWEPSRWGGMAWEEACSRLIGRESSEAVSCLDCDCNISSGPNRANALWPRSAGATFSRRNQPAAQFPREFNCS
jgi:hypothetical protein